MRRLKGFTLIELMIVIVIFGVIMAGIVNLLNPIQKTAVESKIINEQKSAEESIVTCLGENLRYATNLLIVEDSANVAGVAVSSPKTAVQAFYKLCPVNSFGQKIDGNSNEAKKGTHVIIWDASHEYEYIKGNANTKFKGRLLRKTNGVDYTGVGDLLSLDQTGTTGKLHTVFGNAYYGAGDYYLKVHMFEAAGNGYVSINCNSDYYYGKAKTNSDGGMRPYNSDEHSSTLGNFQLRNMGVGSYQFNIAVKSNGQVGVYNTRMGTTDASLIYFVFTTNEVDDDHWPTTNDPDPASMTFNDGSGPDPVEATKPGGTPTGAAKKGASTPKTPTGGNQTTPAGGSQTTPAGGTTKDTTTTTTAQSSEDNTTTTTTAASSESEDNNTTTTNGQYSSTTGGTVAAGGSGTGTTGKVNGTSTSNGTTTVDVVGNGWGSMKLKFEPDPSGGIKMTIMEDTSSFRYQLDQNQFKSLHDTTTFVLTDEQKASLEKQFGIKLSVIA